MVEGLEVQKKELAKSLKKSAGGSKSAKGGHGPQKAAEGFSAEDREALLNGLIFAL